MSGDIAFPWLNLSSTKTSTKTFGVALGHGANPLLVGESHPSQAKITDLGGTHAADNCSTESDLVLEMSKVVSEQAATCCYSCEPTGHQPSLGPRLQVTVAIHKQVSGFQVAVNHLNEEP